MQVDLYHCPRSCQTSPLCQLCYTLYMSLADFLTHFLIAYWRLFPELSPVCRCNQTLLPFQPSARTPGTMRMSDIASAFQPPGLAVLPEVSNTRFLLRTCAPFNKLPKERKEGAYGFTTHLSYLVYCRFLSPHHLRICQHADPVHNFPLFLLEIRIHNHSGQKIIYLNH